MGLATRELRSTLGSTSLKNLINLNGDALSNTGNLSRTLGYISAAAYLKIQIADRGGSPFISSDAERILTTFRLEVCEMD
jgi:hypothetical protein